MPFTKHGLREIVLATLVLGGAAGLVGWWFWPGAIPFVLVWLWVLWFFRDPPRHGRFGPGELCAPADGTVTEVSELTDHDAIGGPAIRIGIFLSLIDVHVNRSPCAGRVRSLSYERGEFLDARHPESGKRNECNALVIDPAAPMPGPVEVRQVAGLVARRIICTVKVAEHLDTGSRIGMIKFGSRTELIIPKLAATEVAVRVGDKVRGGLTVMARQPIHETAPSGVRHTGGLQEGQIATSR